MEKTERERVVALAVKAEEVEVTAFVGLEDVVEEERAVAASVCASRLLEAGQATADLLYWDVEIKSSVGDIENDWIAVLHDRERAARSGFGRDVEDHGAERG